MESQHSTKINKYLALRTTIESNEWSVELSAVEVGARGYRSKSVLCCLKKLGFNNSKIGGQLVKVETLVSCTQSQLGQYLTVPITIDDEVSFINKYSLIATINHSGTLSRGHYWACIKDLHSPCWYLCNDKLISNVEESYFNNTTSNILFYSKV